MALASRSVCGTFVPAGLQGAEEGSAVALGTQERPVDAGLMLCHPKASRSELKLPVGFGGLREVEALVTRREAGILERRPESGNSKINYVFLFQ